MPYFQWVNRQISYYLDFGGFQYQNSRMLLLPQNQHGYWIKEFDSEGGNTYFTDLGIHTTFGLYEIAPYSEGIVEVFVPWKNLK